MPRKYLLLFNMVCLISCYACNHTTKEKHILKESALYPKDADIVTFKTTGRPDYALEILHEIDFFKGSEAPVGKVTGVIELNGALYIADVGQNRVHILDKKSLRYQGSFGGDLPGKLNSLFGIHTDGKHIIAGDRQGPSIFKVYTAKGDFLYNIQRSDPFRGMISTGVNQFFMKDSLAVVSKMMPFNGRKLGRYRLHGKKADLIDDIVPITDLHGELDSSEFKTAIPSMSILPAHRSDSLFYAVPTDKYLVNCYNLQGEKKWSIDLRSIPEVNKTFTIMEQLPFTGYFYAAAIDSADNIYFHTNDYGAIDPADPLEEIVRQTKENDINLNLVAVNVTDRTYRIFKSRNRILAPLNVLDGKLWCYDYMNSQLLVYQLPIPN